MKFSDVVVATASINLIGLTLESVLMAVFVPLNSNMMSDTLAFVIGFLVASLIVGYVFALKIQEESRIRAVGVIAVLSSFTLMVLVMIWFANPLSSPWVKESIGSMFNTSGWSNYEWAAYSGIAVTIDVVFALVFSFIGLYAGSMLKKPKKT